MVQPVDQHNYTMVDDRLYILFDYLIEILIQLVLLLYLDLSMLFVVYVVLVNELEHLFLLFNVRDKKS